MSEVDAGYILGTVSDRTSVEQVRGQLETRSRELEAAMTASHDSLLLVDQHDVIEYGNRCVRSMTSLWSRIVQRKPHWPTFSGVVGVRGLGFRGGGSLVFDSNMCVLRQSLGFRG